MDLVGYSEAVFRGIVREMADFLGKVDVTPAYHIPVSGRTGENIAAASPRMPWYAGPTVLGALDAFRAEPRPVDSPFRMPVQGVYKFTKDGDDRRIVAGTVETGKLGVGDQVVFYPSGKRTRIASFEAFGSPRPTEVSAGEAVGFTLSEQIYAARGEIAVRANEPAPRVSTRLRVSLFWLGRSPLVERKEYLLKLGTARVPMRVESVQRVIDPADLSATEGRQQVERHEVAECTLRLSRAIAFDVAAEIGVTGRFVIVDDHDIRGGGIVREALEDEQATVREKVLVRNYKWEASRIPPERRAEKYNQRPVLLLVTGERSVDRKRFGKELEARLFDDGKIVYFLGIGNVLYGVDADIERREENRVEHFRRLGEVANILLDAGVILIVTAAELEQRDVDVIRTSVEPGRIETIWIGEHVTTDLDASVMLPPSESVGDAVQRLKVLLQGKGIIFRPW
jgi:bifunctional enzyme CysN/CysC